MSNSVTTFFRVLDKIEDPRKEQIISFYEAHKEELTVAKGSKALYQVWPGGYADHVSQSIQLATRILPSVEDFGKQAFTLGQAQVVLAFMGIDHLFKYGRVAGAENFDRENFLSCTLKDKWNVCFTNDEKNALRFGNAANACAVPYDREVGSLAAFVRSVDLLSRNNLSDKGPLSVLSEEQAYTQALEELGFVDFDADCDQTAPERIKRRESIPQPS